MHLAAFVIWLLVGAIAGWIAGTLVRGRGYGLLGDIVVGIVGGFIAGWPFPHIGVHAATGFIGEIIDAAVGAILLLVVLRLIRHA